MVYSDNIRNARKSQEDDDDNLNKFNSVNKNLNLTLILKNVCMQRHL